METTMSEEALADSGVEDSGIDMDAAMDDITQSIFDKEPVVKEVPNESIDESEEVTDEVAEEPEKEETEEEITVKELPASWKKDMQEKWEKIDPETQEYFLQREKQMAEGLEKDRGDANLGRTLRDTMAPYSEFLQHEGVDEPTAIKSLMNAHYRIATADDAGKLNLIKQLAQSYGLSLDGEQQQVDPTIKAMQDKLNGIEHHLSASHEKSLQEARTRVQNDVEKFASEHEFFDDVAEQIVPLINAGYELEDAYQNAIWLNPVTRQKEIDRQSNEAAEKALEKTKQEAEKARKAKSANVRGRDTNRTPTEDVGTMEDTMRETLRNINNR